MSKPLNLHDATGVIYEVPGLGIMSWYKAGVPSNSEAGYAKGCLCQNINGGELYINEGSKTSSTWTLVGTQS